MIELSSPAFQPSAPIPRRYTGEGPDRLPPLHWGGIPEGTRELALLCEDPDAPRPQPWVHAVLYGIPTTIRDLSEHNSDMVVRGRNDFGRLGYGGPLPPKGHGVHHYHFHLYALDQHLDLPAGATKERLLAAIRGHVLDEGELVGTYRR